MAIAMTIIVLMSFVIPVNMVVVAVPVSIKPAGTKAEAVQLAVMLVMVAAAAALARR